MTDAIRPEEYRPQWKFRRIVIWASIAYALSSCALLSWSFTAEAVAGTLDSAEIAGYVALVVAHLGYLALITFQYVWGAMQELKDFFALLQNVSGGGR